MNLHEKKTSTADRWRLAGDLLEASLVDTVTCICSVLDIFWSRPKLLQEGTYVSGGSTTW